MSFNNGWTIHSSYDFQAHQQHSQRRWGFSQTTLLWLEVLPDLSPALPGLSPAFPGLSPVHPGAPCLVVGTLRLVAGAPSYSEGRQECPPGVWYSPETDASKFTLHILSVTPGGFEWLKYIVLMYILATWIGHIDPAIRLITWDRYWSIMTSVLVLTICRRHCPTLPLNPGTILILQKFSSYCLQWINGKIPTGPIFDISNIDRTSLFSTYYHNRYNS